MSITLTKHKGPFGELERITNGGAVLETSILNGICSIQYYHNPHKDGRHWGLIQKDNDGAHNFRTSIDMNVHNLANRTKRINPNVKGSSDGSNVAFYPNINTQVSFNVKTNYEKFLSNIDCTSSPTSDEFTYFERIAHKEGRKKGWLADALLVGGLGLTAVVFSEIPYINLDVLVAIGFELGFGFHNSKTYKVPGWIGDIHSLGYRPRRRRKLVSLIEKPMSHYDKLTDVINLANGHYVKSHGKLFPEEQEAIDNLEIMYNQAVKLVQEAPHIKGLSVFTQGTSKAEVMDRLVYILQDQEGVSSKKTTNIPISPAQKSVDPWDVDFTDYKEALR